MNPLLNKFTFTDELKDVLENCKGVSVPTSKAERYSARSMPMCMTLSLMCRAKARSRKRT